MASNELACLKPLSPTLWQDNGGRWQPLVCSPAFKYAFGGFISSRSERIFISSSLVSWYRSVGRGRMSQRVGFFYNGKVHTNLVWRNEPRPHVRFCARHWLSRRSHQGSGGPDESSWVPCFSRKKNSRGYRRVWALGDVTDVLGCALGG